MDNRKAGTHSERTTPDSEVGHATVVDEQEPAPGSEHVHHLQPSVSDADRPSRFWDEAFDCRACAVRILLLVLHSQRWVMRRVERVSFHDDRSTRRRVSVDFLMPNLAPRYLLGNGQSIRLVPVATMRRKTLVNFSLRDAEGCLIPLTAIRHTQALTKQMILALAEANDVRVDKSMEDFAGDVAAGRQEEMNNAFESGKTVFPDIKRLLKDDGAIDNGAGRLVRRLANHFIVLAILKDDPGTPRRIVKYSYDEPLSLTLKISGYDPTRQAYKHPPRPVHWWHPENLASTIGWSPMIIRFPVPSAENARAYHFEIEAPPGVTVASAALVAGRPNVPVEKPSWDHVTGGFPVVGLHAIEVPNGSMSRCQVELRLNRRGWLTASLVASILSSVLLWVTSLASTGSGQGQVVGAALLAVTAAIMVLIVKPAEHQMATRLVVSVRAAAMASVFLMVAEGAILAFQQTPDPVALIVGAVLASLSTLLVLLAWWRARPPTDRRLSPWEQGLTLGETPPILAFNNLQAAREYFGFDRPAILVESSEGDHRDKFRWTSAHEEYLGKRLSALIGLGSVSQAGDSASP